MSDAGRAVTRELARFAARIRHEELPPPVLEMARRCLVDWLGIAITGSCQPLSPILRAVIDEIGGNPRATIVGLGVRTSTPNAAMVNGTFAHSIDYDDVNLNSGLHASAPVWAATLAVAEAEGASAEEATAAFVAGYEVMARIGLAVGKPMIGANFHSTGVLGYYGAAAAAGRLLGLSEETMARALGIAAGQAGGLIQVRGTMCKPFFAGHSAHGGVLSAIMASKGFDSVTDAVEGVEGILASYPKERSAEEAFAGLGDQWELQANSFKAYPSCAMTHPMLDCLIEFRHEAGIDPSQVEEIRVGMYPYATTYVNRPEVKTGLGGKFSAQYCAAVALLDGEVQERQFTDERTRDPMVGRIMQRVSLFPVEGMPIDRSEVEVRLANGRRLSRRTGPVSGSPENPLSWNQLVRKFEGLALVALPGGRVAELLDRLEAWPNTKIGSLLALTVKD